MRAGFASLLLPMGVTAIAWRRLDTDTTAMHGPLAGERLVSDG